MFVCERGRETEKRAQGEGGLGFTHMDWGWKERGRKTPGLANPDHY